MIDDHPAHKAYWSRPPAHINSNHSAWSRIRQLRENESSKPFLARGHRLPRCSRCLMQPCFCDKRIPSKSNTDYLLIFHRNEVLKPTNTGRLIADCFPANTWACTWTRTNPAPELLTLLGNEEFQPILVFPGEHNPRYTTSPKFGYVENNKRPLLIAIDGTWKQARKIYLQSPWLHTIPALTLNHCPESRYSLRQAPNSQQLATIEAVAESLRLLNFTTCSDRLNHYFKEFNHHYLKMRNNSYPKN